MAMISAPIQVEADIVNGKKPGSLDVSGFQVFPIGHSKIFFIVHPSNPVTSLSEAQMKDIMAGTISNWKDVGGPDSPIAVFAERPGNGTRAVVESVFMQGLAISPKARLVPALAQVAKIVSQTPNAVGYGNSSSVNSSVTVAQGIEVKQPLALVSNGSPNDEMKKLIDAAAVVGAQL
jgi:phosphate transport system substrate-binding protein